MTNEIKQKLNIMKGPILLVDDNQLVTCGLECQLGIEGYLILPYNSAREAIEQIEGGLKYKLAIIDLSLGFQSGADIMKVSKRVNPHVPVICLTGMDPRPLPSYMDDYHKKGDYSSDIVEKIKKHIK